MADDEILIIGAGPAGLAAAIALADGGHHVTVVERRSTDAPSKPCGDGLTPKAMGVLARLGLDAAVRRRAHAPLGVAWRSPGGELRAFVPPARGRTLVLPRRVLAALLRERALAAGARLEHGATVRSLLTESSGRVVGALVDGRPCRAAMVIVASGAVARFAPRDRRPLWWGAQAELATSRPHDWMRFDFIAPLLPGYAWLFPSVDGLVNVGFGTLAPATGRRPLGRGAEDAARAHLGRLVPEARAARFRAAPIACFPRPPTRPGALFVGDAAGLANVFTGEGIYHALLSGVLAAAAICRHGPSAEAERRYRKALHECFTVDRFGARLMSWMACYPGRLEWCMTALAMPPAIRLLNVAMAFERPAWLLAHAGLPVPPR
jgi:flavin-dependent dehydrogenase